MMIKEEHISSDSGWIMVVLLKRPRDINDPYQPSSNNMGRLPKFIDDVVYKNGLSDVCKNGLEI